MPTPPTHTHIFAPATIANLGPGFDVLGLAVTGLGDRVIAERTDGPPGVDLGQITGDGGRLPTAIGENTATVAAASVARRLGLRVRIDLHKGLPLSSGLGSSAASAVAGAAAVAVLAGLDLEHDRDQLIGDALAAEAVASGAAHADNAAPCLLGGAVLVHAPSADPPQWVRLPVPDDLWIALALPDLELDTRTARRALPSRIPLRQAVTGWGRVAGIVAALFSGDLELLGRCVRDDVVEPVRGALIPHFDEVKTAALQAGALACSISGAGPTLFGLAASESAAQSVAVAMANAWNRRGVGCRAHVSRPHLEGACILRDS